MKHLIDPMDLSVQEIDHLLALADDIILHKEKYQEVCKHKKLATLFAVLIFAGTIALVPQLGTELMGQTDEGEASITMSFRPNLSLDAMNRTVVEMERYLV